MRCFIGIDLGSTTTKAVVIDEQQNIIGRGITNSRSNYDTAAAVAKQALINSRFHLFRGAAAKRRAQRFAGRLHRPARTRLPRRAVPRAARRPGGHLPPQPGAPPTSTRPGGRGARRGLQAPDRRGAGAFAPGARRKSDFFRDIAGSQYLAMARRWPSRWACATTTCSTCSTARSSRSRTAVRRLGRRHLMAALERTFAALPETRSKRDGGGRADQAGARHRDGGDLRRRHRLRPRTAALQQGAHPQRDPVPRPGRARDVPGHRHRARHRRAGHQGDPGRPAGIVERASR